MTTTEQPVLMQKHWGQLEKMIEHASKYELIGKEKTMKIAQIVSYGWAGFSGMMVLLTAVFLTIGSSFTLPFLITSLLCVVLGVCFEVSSFKRKNSLEHRDSKIKTLHMIGYGKTLKTDEEKKLYSGLYDLYEQGQHSAYFWGKVKREHLAYCYHHQHSQF